MDTDVGTQQGFQPAGRAIAVAVLGPDGAPAVGAEVRLEVNGRFAGSVLIGSSSAGTVSLEIDDDQATIVVRAVLLGQQQVATLPPGRAQATLVFQSVPRFATAVKGYAQCPDGSSGSPCVICVSGAESWRACG